MRTILFSSWATDSAAFRALHCFSSKKFSIMVARDRLVPGGVNESEHHGDLRYTLLIADYSLLTTATLKSPEIRYQTKG